MILFVAFSLVACQSRIEHPTTILMEELDTNRSGAVDPDELVVAMPQHAITMYDLDQSGDLNAEELDAAMTLWQARTPRRPPRR